MRTCVRHAHEEDDPQSTTDRGDVIPLSPALILERVEASLHHFSGPGNLHLLHPTPDTPGKLAYSLLYNLLDSTCCCWIRRPLLQWEVIPIVPAC